MRHQRTITALLIGTLVSWTPGVTQVTPHADCSFNPSRNAEPRESWRRLSQEAEAVTSGRRRSIQIPPATFTPRNFIDSEIFGKMVKDGIRWTVPASDEEFLRRVTLDLTGQIPTADKVKSFLGDTSSDKRDKLIDELLASPEFAERWTVWFGDLVQNVRFTANINLYADGRNAFYNFILESMRSAKPYDQLVRDVITGRGASFTSGPANYWVRQILTNGPIQDTYDNLSAESGEKFLGLPLNCLSCHNGVGHLEAVNSSLAKRTREEFWKNASFFAKEIHRPQRDANNRVEWYIENASGFGRAPGEYLLNTVSGNKTPRQPAPGQSNVVSPAFFLTGETPGPGEPRRQAYARILTGNSQFARATVNYVWKEIFGLGIVEPAESFDLFRQDPATLPPGATLQPTHPQLITQLADHFVAGGYSLHTLLKTIVTSNAYQLSSVYTAGEWNESWTPYHARHYPRRMLAESVADAICRATGVSQRYNVQGLVVDRAMQLPDPMEPPSRNGGVGLFLASFGRGDRDTTPRSSDGSIVQALLMINDPFVTTRVKAQNNSTVQRVLAASKDPAVIVEELYIATLSRRPTATELSAATASLSGGDLTRKTEDLQFALINRLEFLFK